MIEEALKDLDPNIKEAVKSMIEDHHGKDLEQKLKDYIGLKKAMDLLEKIR